MCRIQAKYLQKKNRNGCIYRISFMLGVIKSALKVAGIAQ